jgi:hypothetical protein
MSTSRAREREKIEAKKAAVFAVLTKATHNDEQELAGQWVAILPGSQCSLSISKRLPIPRAHAQAIGKTSKHNYY